MTPNSEFDEGERGMKWIHFFAYRVPRACFSLILFA